MSFITETQLSNYRTRTKTFSKDNIVNLNESYSRDKTKPMVFLSHKHDEFSILQDVIAFLKDEGVDVYVDWMDEDMPAYTNNETAVRLKEKIRTADKFILVATSNAINSKWCNWELGLGDAAKYIDHIAILPIKKDYSDFTGNEYLQIYPYIVSLDISGYIKDSYKLAGAYIVYPDGKILQLKDWLKSK